MILFQLVVKILVRSMLHFSTQYRAYDTWVGVVAIGSYLIRFMSNNFSGLCKEALGCLHVSVLRKHGIYEVALPVNSSIEVAPFPVHFDVSFVSEPGPTRLARMPGA